MVRYVKQRDQSSCGPVAIINIFKWMECRVTYRFINIARYLCSWQDGRSKDGGTYELGLEKALKILEIKKKRKIGPTLKEIDKHIDDGGAVLIGYWHPFNIPGFAKKNEGHYTLCIGRTKKAYILVNDSNKTVIKRNRTVMKSMTRHKVNDTKCWAWFITK